LTLALASFAGAHADSALAQQTAPSPAPPTVSVTGVATDEAAPDIASITFNLSDQRPTAADAEGENARVTTAVVAGLKASGIDDKDVSTLGLSLFPIWSEERDPKTGATLKRTLTGYQASATLRVRVRAIDKAGALVAQGVQNGATYQAIAFDLSDREAREDALRVKATANAMHRASLYAQGAAMKLGPLQSISAEGGQPAYPLAGAPRALAMTSGASPMPIEPGEITLSESVVATWTLAPQ
jgi:hypothetical protein